MFNKDFSKTIVSNHVNAVSGNITKTYPKSYFKRFHLKSTLAETLLSDEPRCCREKVQVIQMVICGDMEVIAEIMNQDDYNELFL